MRGKYPVSSLHHSNYRQQDSLLHCSRILYGPVRVDLLNTVASHLHTAGGHERDLLQMLPAHHVCNCQLLSPRAC